MQKEDLGVPTGLHEGILGEGGGGYLVVYGIRNLLAALGEMDSPKSSGVRLQGFGVPTRSQAG